MKKIATLLIVIVTLGFISYGQVSGTFKDGRDGTVYRWVKIGNQVWMAENLRYPAGSGSGYYDLNTYGRFYDWYTACKACPPGWHLPSDSEWKQLESNLGMSASELNREYHIDRESGQVGLKLKSRSGWKFYLQNGNGTDSYGFTALPGGYFQYYTKRYMYYGSGITFWTSTSQDGENAITRDLGSSHNSIDRAPCYKVHGCYIRCVKD